MIRPAQDADFPAIAAVYAHHVETSTATFELEPPGADEMLRRCAEARLRGLPWLVAAAEGGVVGYGYAAPYRARPAYRFTVEDSLYLDPAWNRRGIGRALLLRLIDDCAALGCRQMLAVIGDRANVASLGLHRALGFVDAGVQRAVGLKFGRWIDTITLQRALGPGDSGIPGLDERGIGP